jgi:putative hemolysin
MDQFLTTDLSEILMIGICILSVAFFSAAETAITSLGVLKARHAMQSRGGSAQALRLWLQHPSRVLTTILIFSNLAKVLASVLAADIAIRHLGDQALGFAIGAVTLLILVIGEIIPKSFARANSEGVSQLAMLGINILYRLFYPIIWFFSELATRAIRRLGSEQSLQPTITEEELEFLIEVGEKSGVIEDMKKEMINGVFEFDETKVREIQTPRTDIVAVEKSDSIEHAVRLIIQSGHSRLPVYDEQIDNIMGIVFAKDLLRHLADPKRKSGTPAPGLTSMMREPQFVPESKPLMEVFKELKQSKNHMASIIDEYGGTAGLVTMEDILEEIVGDIQDEFDAEEAKILKIEEDIYDVAGYVNISEFVEFFELDESFAKDIEGEVDTIAGWMTQLLGHLPEVGQSVTHGVLTFEVTEVDRHRIERLRVTRHPQSEHETVAEMGS